MAVGQEADDEALDEVGLADDDLADFVEEGTDEGGGALDFVVDCFDAGAHVVLIVTEGETTRLANAFRKSRGGEKLQARAEHLTVRNGGPLTAGEYQLRVCPCSPFLAPGEGRFDMARRGLCEPATPGARPTYKPQHVTTNHELLFTNPFPSRPNCALLRASPRGPP